MAAATNERSALRIRALFSSLFRDPHSRFHKQMEAAAVRGALAAMSEDEANEALRSADRAAETILRFRLGELS